MGYNGFAGWPGQFNPLALSAIALLTGEVS